MSRSLTVQERARASRERSAGDRAEVLIGPPGWTDRAACRDFAGAAVDIWHDHDAREIDHPQARLIADARRIEARLICATCPVRLDCFEYALRLNRGAGFDGAWGIDGIYAGLAPGELRRLARASGLSTRKRAQHGSRSRYVAGCRCNACRRGNARGENRRRRELRSA